MRVFKVKISGCFISEILRNGCKKAVVVNNAIPSNAELISTEFDWKTKNLELYFIHREIGTEMPEGASMKDCVELHPEFKSIND